MELIDKAAVVAKIERLQDATMDENANFYSAKAEAEYHVLCELECFIDTLEVKEVYEHNDSDLDSILEGIGVEHDSKLAKMFKTAFYNGIDTYLAQKGE